MKASKIAGVIITIAATLLGTRDAKADDEPKPDPREPAFRYTMPAKRQYLRATLEEIVVLGVGYAQYTIAKQSNVRDFDNSPDWDTLKSKLLLGSGVSFDNNLYDTNWLTHPLAGFFYYGVARSNRLSIPVATAAAFVGSTLWETFGEIREDASINDLIATPLAGMATYEPLLQTGAFFQRARKTPGSLTLAWIFAPFKMLHDAIDGLEPERATEVDDAGLPLDTWHRLRAGGSAGVTHQEDGVTQGDARFWGESRIVTLPFYGQPKRIRGWFDSAEVSEMRVQAGVSEGRLVDLNLSAHMLPFGYRAQDAEGDGIVGGMHVGVEYAKHNYDRDRRDNRNRDRVSFVATGVTVEGTQHAGPALVRLRLDTLGTFAGVDAYALPEYDDRYDLSRVTSVLLNQGYYHAFGATIRPRAEVEIGRFDCGFDLRGEWFRQVVVRDRGMAPIDLGVTATDRRLQSRAFVGFRPTPHIRVSLMGEANQRMGRMDDVRAARGEIGLHGGMETIF